jgi:hypothetical protein
MPEQQYLTREERVHVIDTLKKTKKALLSEDAVALRDLSNQTIHCASIFQDGGSITFAVIVYALSKLIERKDALNIKNWDSFVKRINSKFDMAIESIENERFDDYLNDLQQARKVLASISESLTKYVYEVLRKASINKASKIYEHGLSMEKTAELLGVTQWELSEYIGQSPIAESKQSQTIDIKKRAKEAMEFFS